MDALGKVKAIGWVLPSLKAVHCVVCAVEATMLTVNPGAQFLLSATLSLPHPRIVIKCPLQTIVAALVYTASMANLEIALR